MDGLTPPLLRRGRMTRYVFIAHETAVSRPYVRGPASPDPRADMRPCAVCGWTDRQRMHALMTLWFGHLAGVPLDHGYFYLCPSCFSRYIPQPESPPAADQPGPLPSHSR